MSDGDLAELERFVADNDDLFALEEQIGRFNIFDALNVARAEIRHSNFLAWLLTPAESHAQGDLFLKALLMDVLRKAREQGVRPPLSAVDLDGADLRGVDVRREWRHVDLLITCESPRFVIAIENKVDSGEHSNQLQRYEDTVAAEFVNAPALFVFLTPDGDDASDDDWVSYSYADLHRTLTRTRRTNAGATGGDVAVFLDHYLSLIGNRFMENPDIDKLCRQIYANHRRAMDLIWERVGSPSSAVIGRIEAWLEARPHEWVLVTTKQREIEFHPAAWRGMLPPIGKRRLAAPDGWIIIRMRALRSGRLRMFVVVCPTTDVLFRRAAVARLLQDKGEFGLSRHFKGKSPTDDWTRILSEDVCPLPDEDEDEPNYDVVMSKVEKRLDSFLRQTATLPDAMKRVVAPTPAVAQ
ncbi:MAG TPA: PD-(D/E)XK nuclease family protein [Tepidisphaeraceae bacterium]|nr:PD-(D/E)XK nuclease family protein [Tepidisphaeraceae bacterium]